MGKLDSFIRRRREIAAIYDEAFSEIDEIITPPGGSGHVYHIYVIQLRTEMLPAGRKEIFEALGAENIGVQVHYVPLHLQPFYKNKFGYKKGDYPVAERYYERAITLPLFPAMSDKDIGDVISAVKKGSGATGSIMMDYKLSYYNDISREQWDGWLAGLNSASYHHCRYWLDYCSRFQNVAENKSFILMENKDAPLAVCPLFLSEIGGKREISVNGAPVGVPALADDIKPSHRRRLMDIVFGIIDDYATVNKAERIVMVSHPLTRSVCRDEVSGYRNTFECCVITCSIMSRTLGDGLGLPQETLLQNWASTSGGI
jgi:hypothetical protein